MSDLSKFTAEELKAELKNREKKAKFARPVMLDNPDYTSLRTCIAAGIEKMIEDEFEDEDFSHFVYEAAIEAVYGKEYWTWRASCKF